MVLKLLITSVAAAAALFKRMLLAFLIIFELGDLYVLLRLLPVKLVIGNQLFRRLVFRTLVPEFETIMVLLRKLAATLSDNIEGPTLVLDVVAASLTVAHSHAHAFFFTVVLLVAFTESAARGALLDPGVGHLRLLSGGRRP